MHTILKTWIIIGLCFLNMRPVLADEVLYCVDTDVIGFKWDKKGEPSVKFDRGRYTIKVVSDTERLITEMEGDKVGDPDEYECSRPFPDVKKDLIVCKERTGTFPWHFYREKYTRAFLYGLPVGGDSNISIAYGTCTKF